MYLRTYYSFKNVLPQVTPLSINNVFFDICFIFITWKCHVNKSSLFSFENRTKPRSILKLIIENIRMPVKFIRYVIFSQKKKNINFLFYYYLKQYAEGRKTMADTW